MSPEYGPDVVLPGFRALEIDIDQCRRDLDDFDALLAPNEDLKEREHILPFFRARPHLTLFLASYAVNLDDYDRLAYEFDIFSLFRADAVIGEWSSRNYCFVEFEDATATSIFVRGDRRTTEWSDRFEAGYSQITDWFWALEAYRDTEAFERKFGQRRINTAALLVVGRDYGVTGGDRLRLEWRRNHVIVNSQRIICCTYDELLRGLYRKLDVRSRTS